MKKLLIIPLLFLTLFTSAQFTHSGGTFLKTGSSFQTAQAVPGGPSATPVIESGTASVSGTASTTLVVTMPTGYQSGDLILVIYCASGTGTITPTGGWTIEGNDADASNRGAVIWIISDGSDALTVTNTNTTTTSATAYRITGFKTADPITTTIAKSDYSTNANPPANTGVYGAVNYLWIVTACFDGTTTASAAPTDFSGLVSQSGSDGSVSTANRAYNTAAAYNPGVFTSAGQAWVSHTIIINPI